MEWDTIALLWAQPSVFTSARFKVTHKTTSDNVIMDDMAITNTYNTYSTTIPQSDKFELYVESLGGHGTPTFTNEISLLDGFSCGDSLSWLSSTVAQLTYECPEFYPNSPWKPTEVYLVTWNSSDPINSETRKLEDFAGTADIDVLNAFLMEYILLGVGDDGNAPIEGSSGYLFGEVLVLQNALGDSVERSDIPWTRVTVIINGYVSEFHNAFFHAHFRNTLQKLSETFHKFVNQDRWFHHSLVGDKRF